MSILAQALRVIPKQSLQLQAFVSRAENAYGETVPVFDDPVDFRASAQPVDKKFYQALGLNLLKNYITVWPLAEVRPVARDVDGDLVLFGGKTWQAISDRDWLPSGEYQKVLCVEVANG